MVRLIRKNLLAILLVFAVGIFVGAGLHVQPVHSQNAVDVQTELLRDLYQRVNPSVVSIEVRIPAGNLPATSMDGSDNAQAAPFAIAAGSGFVYDDQGHIVTNAHVVQGADRVELTFSDDTILRATIVGIDPDSDLAVLKAEGDISKYKPLPLGNSDQVVVGQRAIAIGNPFQRAGTMTNGIVSGVHRSVLGTDTPSQYGTYTIPDAIQTDAALNPGNSGGPLLNANGEVIGVNEQIASSVRQSSGVSFAIPSNLVKITADVLIKNGHVEHSYLGVSGQSLDLDLTEALGLPAQQRGAYVLTVVPGGPAAQASLKAASSTSNVNSVNIPKGGDIIIAIDGQPVRHFDDLTAYLFIKTQPGQKVTLTVLRDGKSTDIQVTLGARPRPQQ